MLHHDCVRINIDLGSKFDLRLCNIEDDLSDKLDPVQKRKLTRDVGHTLCLCCYLKSGQGLNIPI